MSATISLLDLANLSIGSPEVGSVNFCALHSLLLRILRQLNIQDETAEWQQQDRHSGSQTRQQPQLYPLEKLNPYQHMQDKLQEMERKLAVLGQLPGGEDLLSRSGPGRTPVSDMWQLMRLQRSAEANGDGVSQAMTLIQDLLKEINELKTSRDSLQGDVQRLQQQLSELNMKELQDKIASLEKCCLQVDSQEKLLRDLQEKMGLYPSPEDLDKFVTWEVLQDTLVNERAHLQEQLKAPRSGAQSSDQLPLQTAPALPPSAHAPTPPLQPDSETPSQSAMPQESLLPGYDPSVPASWKHCADNPGEETNSIHSAPTHPSHPSPAGSVPSLPTTLPDSSASTPLPCPLAVCSVGTPPHPGRASSPGLSGSVGVQVKSRSGSSRASSGIDLYPETVEALRHVGQLKERHEALEDRVALLEKNKAELSQLQELQALLADMAKRDLPDNLLEQLNQLKATVESLSSEREKDSDLLAHVQKAILQLQAECEKLSSTANHLLEEQSQKQKHIDHLYKSMDELEEKKADKDRVEMDIDVKADKRALDSKVSRLQFDTTTEQLNSMFQELLNKISGQEQDWQKVIEKISSEMECKLNRMELDPLKQQLESRWKAIRKQLQEQPTPQYKVDDAAGIRKQLVARFHCISCDRAVDMAAPGSYMVSVPSLPGFPSHKSSRPYTVYELDQVRQNSRSEQISEVSDCDYLAVSRSCGGSHTLTYPHRRGTRLQQVAQTIQAEEEAQPPLSSQFEEIDILGLDGRIYRGRMDPRACSRMDSKLPTICPKDSTRRSKDKVDLSSSQKPTTVEQLPTRQQSARTQRGHSAHSASARSLGERPTSSFSRRCQTTTVRPPSPVETARGRQGTLEIHMDLSHSTLEEPVTSL
ncbi:uncharacterized protein C16orf96 [Amia ocellicauda]|uniref:uncharacterized protein C16orf96 n=1 Tax=Amia ocellicauda TaxID=2972642 RepID=UPI0034645830